jgi:hypothetical protein
LRGRCGRGERAGSRRANQRRATREAILQNVAPYRNEDGSYTVAAATWGVLVR